MKIAIQSNSTHKHIIKCHFIAWIINKVKRQLKRVIYYRDMHVHTPTHTHASTDTHTHKHTGSSTIESLAAPVRHQRRQQLAPCTEKGREKDDGGYTESVRSNVRSPLSSSALWWAPFILADSNLYVKLTSLHRLGSSGLTGAVQLHWQFYSAITQLQGAG